MLKNRHSYPFTKWHLKGSTFCSFGDRENQAESKWLFTGQVLENTLKCLPKDAMPALRQSWTIRKHQWFSCQSCHYHDSTWGAICSNAMGSPYAITVVNYSWYFELDNLISNSTSQRITKLRGQFAWHGIPAILTSNNRQQLSSSKLTLFMKNWCIKHQALITQWQTDLSRNTFKPARESWTSPWSVDRICTLAS
jgi:hypothetical protein